MRINVKVLQVLAAIVFTSVAVTVQATPQTGYFIYDEAGHLIGEYDSNGNVIQEHIYLGDRPVAVVQQGGSVGYVTTDQLNTPRAITDSSQSVEWSWNSDPFGNRQPTGSLTYNLRFPGQYFDSETGHNYNYYRDYDPNTGRYIESDPIGARGGANTYGYVKDDPISLTDPLGLDAFAYFAPNPNISSPICNGNGGVTWYAPHFGPPYDECFRDCSIAHEQFHVSDLYSVPGTPCQGQAYGTRVAFANQSRNNESERNAYEVTMKCLTTKLARLADCDKCKPVILARIAQIQQQLQKYGGN